MVPLLRETTNIRHASRHDRGSAPPWDHVDRIALVTPIKAPACAVPHRTRVRSPRCPAPSKNAGRFLARDRPTAEHQASAFHLGQKRRCDAAAHQGRRGPLTTISSGPLNIITTPTVSDLLDTCAPYPLVQCLDGPALPRMLWKVPSLNGTVIIDGTSSF